MTRRVPNRSRRSWARFALFLLVLFPLVPSRLAAADPVSRISGSRSRAGDPRSRGGGLREGGGAGAGGSCPSARDVRQRDPFHERRSGPDLRTRGPGRLETRVVRIDESGDARGAALRPPLVLACLGGRGAIPARGVLLRRRRVVGSASPVRSRVARARRVACSVRLRLGVLVRNLGVPQSPPAGGPRADIGRRPPPQGSPPAGDPRLRDRPRRFCGSGSVRGRDRRRRGLLDRPLDRVPAPRRVRDRGDRRSCCWSAFSFAAASSKRFTRWRQRRGRGDGWEGRGTSTGAGRSPEMPGRGR